MSFENKNIIGQDLQWYSGNMLTIDKVKKNIVQFLYEVPHGQCGVKTICVIVHHNVLSNTFQRSCFPNSPQEANIFANLQIFANSLLFLDKKGNEKSRDTVIESVRNVVQHSFGIVIFKEDISKNVLKLMEFRISVQCILYNLPGNRSIFYALPIT